MRVTDLLSSAVYSRSGKQLGHIFDVEGTFSTNKKPSSLLITGIVYGKKGLLDRLGIKENQGKRVSWKQVIKIEKGKLFIKG